jgi:hypothetical protein
MYRHLRMAMRQAQERRHMNQARSNERRRRRPDREMSRTARLVSSPPDVTTHGVDEDVGPQEPMHSANPLAGENSGSEHEGIGIDLDFTDATAAEFRSDFDLNWTASMDDDDQDDHDDSEDEFEQLDFSYRERCDQVLHRYTDIKTSDFCKQLTEIFRDASISRVCCSRLLLLINSVLPQPHNAPKSLKALHQSMNGERKRLQARPLPSSNVRQEEVFLLVEQLFDKRSVCTLCHADLASDQRTCGKCSSPAEKHVADVFDVNQPLVFTRVLDRLLPEIEANHARNISNDASCQDNNDIMFNDAYRKLRNDHASSPFVSLLLHIDGISLSKSSKLTLWLLSAALVEVPAHRRYHRFNMLVLSAWIGYCEPDIDLWLRECLSRLSQLKKTGMAVFSAARDSHSSYSS